MLPASHSGGSKPTKVMDAPVSFLKYMRRAQQQRLTYEPPGIAVLMYHHGRRVDIRGIAEVGQPHVLNVKVVESLRMVESEETAAGANLPQTL